MKLAGIMGNAGPALSGIFPVIGVAFLLIGGFPSLKAVGRN